MLPLENNKKRPISHNHCFLCQVELGENRTVEHVFPKWLQRELQLYDYTLALPNRTRIPYRNIVIPCCDICNGITLSQLETTVYSSFKGGYNSFIKLPEITIYQWIGKLFYGLMFKDIELLVDRRYPQKGTILTPKFLEDFDSLHSFLQSLILPTEFIDFSPWSYFIFRTHVYEEITKNFDYSDSPFMMHFSIRMNDIGIIATLGDFGWVKDALGGKLNKYIGYPLHPIQFDEVNAIVVYQASLQQRTPMVYTIKESAPETPRKVFQIPGFSLVPYFQEWDMDDFIYVFSNFMIKWGLKMHELSDGKGCILTFLENPDGSIKRLTKEGRDI